MQGLLRGLGAQPALDADSDLHLAAVVLGILGFCVFGALSLIALTQVCAGLPKCQRGWCRLVVCSVVQCTDGTPTPSNLVGMPSPRALRFEFTLLLFVGCLVRAVILLIQDPLLDLDLHLAVLPVLEIVPEGMFLSAYLCLAAFLVRTSTWGSPRWCCKSCMRAVPFIERVLPVAVTCAALVIGIFAAGVAPADTWAHFRSGVQTVLSILNGFGAIMSVWAGWRASSLIESQINREKEFGWGLAEEDEDEDEDDDDDDDEDDEDGDDDASGAIGMGGGGVGEIQAAIRAVVLVVGILILLLTVRSVWAALIASGVVPAIDGVPTLLSSEPSVYDMALFTLTELIPSAFLLWGIRTRADATVAGEDALLAEGGQRVGAARPDGGYRAPVLTQWQRGRDEAAPGPPVVASQQAGYGAMGTFRQPSVIPFARLESTDDAAGLGSRASGLALAASGRHAPHEWGSTSEVEGPAGSGVGADCLADMDESLVDAAPPGSASWHQLMEGSQRGAGSAAAATPARSGERAGLMSPDSDFRTSTGRAGARGGLASLGTPKQLFSALGPSPRPSPDR
ncbi:hypothetical protein FNF29_00455 [Cafeteria roenbergensis]|uniref:Uncharacterized protein n=2 Tax=Cafeteria roenbergensis TaxID=33653 RepID=A0A5A8CVC6_CAFRO|nr:hypothetical protein FNF29_00455 [Cafeteria roenbergensis]|eukprot:KAA0157103.1 hypothetical protein FNF29_00455 [Cafeteria roenbergensis]